MGNPTNIANTIENQIDQYKGSESFCVNCLLCFLVFFVLIMVSDIETGEVFVGNRDSSRN